MGITFFRTFILYAVIVIALRFSGKRQIGELQPSELVITILISNIAALPIEDTNVPLIIGILPIAVLVCIEIVMSFLSSRNVRINQMLSGSSKIIIKNGRIDQEQLAVLRISPTDIYEEMRQNNIYDINDIMFGIVETNGKISIGTKDDTKKLPKILVVENGKIIYKNLEYCNIDKDWIISMIKREDLTLNQVYIMLCDPEKDYRIIRKTIDI